MRFVLSGHDVIRLATALEPVDGLREALVRVSRDDGSVVGKGRNGAGTEEHVRTHGSDGGARRTVSRV